MNYKALYDDLYMVGYHSGDICHTVNYFDYIISKGYEFNSILDCGCSTGNFLRYAKAKGYNDIKGIDVSGVAISKCAKRNLNASQSSLVKIPHGNKMFDLVISTEVIEHLEEEDVRKALNEMCRVSNKYVAFSVCFTPERNKGWLQIITQLSQWKDLQNLHLTCKDEQFYIDELAKMKSFKIIHMGNPPSPYEDKSMANSGFFILERKKEEA